MSAVLTDPPSKGPWHWKPAVPLGGVPVFTWPARPWQALRYLLSPGFLGTVVVQGVATASLAWFLLQPDLSRSVRLESGWVLQILARNFLLMVLFTTALHLYLHTFKMQAMERRFDHRELAKNNRRYFLGSQLWDNVFWSLVSGVTLWTAYEVLFFWLYANNYIPMLRWQDNPVWFVFVFFAIPFWNSFHFYFIHRFLHLKPIYRSIHEVHHRNVTLGPWSGLSMHPVEHLLFFSSALIHLVVPSHPLHLIFHMHFLTLATAQGHSGYQDLRIAGRSVLKLDAFHHQLHHRYFRCNYGNEYVPCDKWFGTDNDGTERPA